MTTTGEIASWAVASSREEVLDLGTRRRIAAHLRELKYRFKFQTDAAMAAHLGMSRSALGRYLKGERTAGLDVLLLVKRHLGQSIDYIVTRPPEDKRWLDPNWLPPDAPR